MNTSHTPEPITCTHCGHAIRENEPVLAELPSDVPQELSRAAFRHWHLSCQECNSGVSCYQASAANQTPFAAQFATACAWCDRPIVAGDDVVREAFFVWHLCPTEDHSSGTIVGVSRPGQFPKRSATLQDLPKGLRKKLRVAGLGNDRGFRTAAETKEFLTESVPRDMRNLGPDAVGDFVRGRHASHVESVANAPGKAKSPGNIRWESPKSNLARGADSMTRWDRVRISATNGVRRCGIAGKVTARAAGKAAALSALAELLVSGAEGTVRVAKGKRSRGEAAKDAAVNSIKAGLVGGGVTAGVVVIAAFGAGPALSAVTPVLVPLGIGVYGVSAYRRIKDAAKDDEPLERMALYFHANCAKREDYVSCFEVFAAEVSESATDQGGTD